MEAELTKSAANDQEVEPYSKSLVTAAFPESGEDLEYVRLDFLRSFPKVAELFLNIYPSGFAATAPNSLSMRWENMNCMFRPGDTFQLSDGVTNHLMNVFAVNRQAGTIDVIDQRPKQCFLLDGLNSAGVKARLVSIGQSKFILRVSLDELHKVLVGYMSRLNLHEVTWMQKTFALSAADNIHLATALLQSSNIELQTRAYDILRAARQEVRSDNALSSLATSQLLYATESLSLLIFREALQHKDNAQFVTEAVRFGDAERALLKELGCAGLARCGQFRTFTETQLLNLYYLTSGGVNGEAASALLIRARSLPNSDEIPDIEYVVNLTGIGTQDAFQNISPQKIRLALSVLDGALLKSDRRIKALDPGDKATYKNFLQGAIGNGMVLKIRTDRMQIFMARAECFNALGETSKALSAFSSFEALASSYLAADISLGREQIVDNFFSMLYKRSGLLAKVGQHNLAGRDGMTMTRLKSDDWRGYAIAAGALDKLNDRTAAQAILRTGIENTTGDDNELMKEDLVRLSSAAAANTKAAPRLTPGYSADRELTAADLQVKSAQQLDLMRNEIFARHGQVFHRADLKAYFSQFSWYKPSADGSVYERLSETEKKNIALIASYEKQQH